MCFFITIAVPSGHAEAVARLPGGRGLCIDRTENPGALAAAGAGFTPLLLTHGGCSCGFYRRPRGAGLKEELIRRRRRYERSGWSPGKIERALGQARRSAEPGDGLHPVAQDLVREVVGLCGMARVWVHDFRGRVEDERYSIVKRASCGVGELASVGQELDVDVLLTVTTGS